MSHLQKSEPSSVPKKSQALSYGADCLLLGISGENVTGSHMVIFGQKLFFINLEEDECIHNGIVFAAFF